MASSRQFSGFCILFICITEMGALNHHKKATFELNPKLRLTAAYENKVYFVEEIMVPWSVANKTCVDNSMTLVKIHSNEELKYLSTILTESGYWTDARDKREFEYGDSSSTVHVSFSQADYDNCACLYANFESLHRTPCATNMQPLCELITGTAKQKHRRN